VRALCAHRGGLLSAVVQKDCDSNKAVQTKALHARSLQTENCVREALRCVASGGRSSATSTRNSGPFALQIAESAEKHLARAQVPSPRDWSALVWRDGVSQERACENRSRSTQKTSVRRFVMSAA
jgi:hypothetical protein